MDYKRIALAAVVAWVVDSAYGVIVWMKLLGGEFAKYPALFRPEADMNAHMPLAFAGSLLAMFALAAIYAKGYEGGKGVVEGIRASNLVMSRLRRAALMVSVYFDSIANNNGRCCSRFNAPMDWRCGRSRTLLCGFQCYSICEWIPSSGPRGSPRSGGCAPRGSACSPRALPRRRHPARPGSGS